MANYVNFDPNAFNEDRAREEAASSSTRIWLKFPQGTTIVRVLPPPVEWIPWFTARSKQPAPFIGYHEHMYQDDDGSYKSYICPRNTKLPGQRGAKCPDCEREYLLRTESDDKTDHELAKKIRAKYKIACNVLVRASSDRSMETGVVKPWSMSALSPSHRAKIIQKGGEITTRTLFEKLEERFMARPGRRGRDIVNPTDKGYDVIVKRAGEGLNTTYSVDVSDDPIALADSDELIDKIIASQPDITKLVHPATAAELAELFGQSAPRASGGGKVSHETVSMDLDGYINNDTNTDGDDLPF